jgi:hypothetical protein
MMMFMMRGMHGGDDHPEHHDDDTRIAHRPDDYHDAHRG